MATDSELTLNHEESLTIKDAEGHELICVSFDMDPGMHLVNIMIYDTDGQPLLDLGINYLGTGYPQCSEPGSQTFINRVERSTLPVRESESPFKIVKHGERIKTERRELDPDDPKTETWCSLAQKED